MITVDPTSGRVLQASLHGRDAFWVADEPRGWNVGGDRLWLGPERDWFWLGEGRDDLSRHVVPPEIDPGKWDVVHQRDDRIDLVLTARLRDRNTGTVSRVAVERSITVLTDTRYAIEYETETVLHVYSGQPVDLWSVVQVPLGGTLEIGLRGPFAYHDELAPIDPGRFTLSENSAAIRLDGKQLGKIGVAGDLVAGPLRYTLPGLVIERHVVGAVVEVFEDDGHYGGYAELEHHSFPAAEGQTVTDVCRTVLLPRVPRGARSL